MFDEKNAPQARLIKPHLAQAGVFD